MIARCTHYQGVCNRLVCTRNEEPDDYVVKTPRRRRVTLYAAVYDYGRPVQNLWDFNKRKLETLVNDRHANGQAFPGERVVQMTERFYDALLARHGLPERSAEPGERHTAEPGGR